MREPLIRPTNQRIVGIRLTAAMPTSQLRANGPSGPSPLRRNRNATIEKLSEQNPMVRRTRRSTEPRPDFDPHSITVDETGQVCRSGSIRFLRRANYG